MHMPTQPLPAPPTSPISFSGERPAFRRLIVRGGLLELLTFGFYRFWLATDIRRHLWAHSSVDGDPAEYRVRMRSPGCWRTRSAMLIIATGCAR